MKPPEITITNKNKTGTDMLIAHLTEALAFINVKISGIELVLSANSTFEYGLCEKLCKLKVKFDEYHSIAASNHAISNELALDGAINELKTKFSEYFSTEKTQITD